MKLIVTLCLINVVLSDYKFTEEIRSKCKVYKSNSGYSYTNYFKVTGGHRPEGMKFEMHLAIKAKNNGHILLSNGVSPGPDEPVYELTVGAGANTFTELRRMRMKQGKSTTDTIGLLKEDEFVPFWIKAYDDGLVEFGREGTENAIVTYTDPNPLNITHFSFTSWKGIPATFLYDCPVAGNFTDISEEVEKNLTAVEKLRKDLFKNYDVYLQPIYFENITNVLLEYSIKSVSFDVKTSILTTIGILRAHWTDSFLRWDPLSYDNISYQNFHIEQIWKPEIMIYESLNLDRIKWTDSSVLVKNDGKIATSTSVVAKTWCSSHENIADWPHDSHKCNLKMGLWSQHAQLNLTTDNSKSTIDPLISYTDKFIPSEWELVTVLFSSEWTKYSPYVQLLESESDSDSKVLNTFNFKMEIKRINGSFRMTLYTPFLCTLLIIFITFWISTSPYMKITVLCAELLIVMVLSFVVMDEIPVYAERIPSIVLFYFWAVLAIWLSIIVNVFLAKMTSNPEPWMRKLRKYLTEFKTGTCFLFSNIKMDDGYKSYDADKCDEDEEDEDVREWSAMGTAVDRIIFTVFTVIFGICCVLK